MKRKLMFAGLAMPGIVASLLAAAYLAMTMWFNPSPPTNTFPQARSALEAQQQDLDQFKRLLALDQSYSPRQRNLANRTLDSLRASSRVLSWGGLRVALMRIAAMADNGHTGVYSGDALRPNAVPVRVTEFSDGLFVLRAKTSELLGARVEKVDGIPTDDVLRKLATLHGGTAAHSAQPRGECPLWVDNGHSEVDVS